MKEENTLVKKLKSIVSNIWYLVALVAACTIVIMLIWNWEMTLGAIGKLIGVFMPFIVGFILAYLMMPFVRIWNKLFDHIKPGQAPRVKKAISMLIAYVIVLGILTVIIVFIAPQISQSVKELVKTVQKGYGYIKSHPNSFLDWIPFVNTQEVMEKLKDNITSIATNASNVLFPYIYNIFSSSFSFIYSAFFGIVISMYFIWDKDFFARRTRRLVRALTPKDKSEIIWKKLLNCNKIFNGFLVGKAIDSFIIGIICFVAMLVLGFPYPVLLSVIVCITNMIPYFGPIIGAIPGCAIYLFIDPMLAVWYALLILILQQFDGWVLGPWVLGDQMGIKPLSVFLGVVVGGAYFGVLGMFVGVPVVGVLQYLGGDFIKKKLKKKGIHDPLDPEPDNKKGSGGGSAGKTDVSGNGTDDIKAESGNGPARKTDVSGDGADDNQDAVNDGSNDEFSAEENMNTLLYGPPEVIKRRRKK